MELHLNASNPRRLRGREIALNTGAIAGLICVLAAAASFFFGVKPLVFRSGSMSPDITTGALALSKTASADDLRVGDVVSVVNDQGTRITHRIQEIVSTNGATSVLILKGDANKDADVAPYTVTEVDRVFFSVPGLGYVVSWLSSPAAIFLGGGLVGGVVVLAFGPAAKRKDDDDSEGAGGASGLGADPRLERSDLTTSGDGNTLTQQFRALSFQTRRVLPARTAIVFGTVGLAVIGASALGTSAAFADSAVASSSFGSKSDLLPAPKWLGCSGSSGGVTLRWAHIGPGYTYDIKLYNGRGGSWTPTIPSNKGDEVSIWVSYWDNIRLTAAESYVEVKAKRNGETGTAYSGEKIWSSGVATGWCNGARSNGVQAASLLVASGDNGAQLKGPTSSETQQTAPTTSSNATTTQASTSSATPSALPSSTTTPTTTSPASAPTTGVSSTETSTIAPTATTTTTSRPTTSTTTGPESQTAASTTTVGAAQLADATKSPSGTYVAGISGRKAVVQDSAGDELFSQSVSSDADVQWDSVGDTLWIIDAGKIYRVSAGTWSVAPIDPASTDLPTRVAALVK